jgi:hypothetical protein
MYYKGRGDNIGRLLELMHLQKDMRYIGYHNLGLKNYDALVEEVDEEIEMLKREDHSHV